LSKVFWFAENIFQQGEAGRAEKKNRGMALFSRSSPVQLPGVSLGVSAQNGEGADVFVVREDLSPVPRGKAKQKPLARLSEKSCVLVFSNPV